MLSEIPVSVAQAYIIGRKFLQLEELRIWNDDLDLRT
jgi:hypothetical protein